MDYIASIKSGTLMNSSCHFECDLVLLVYCKRYFAEYIFETLRLLQVKTEVQTFYTQITVRSHHNVQEL